MSESESKNSDIAISRPKKKNTEEESGSDSKGLNIEQFFPSFGIKETIFISDNESEDESKENINFFFFGKSGCRYHHLA